MATKEYAVKAPDGSTLRFMAPADAPREKILAFAKKQFESRPQQPVTELAAQAPAQERPIGRVGRARQASEAEKRRREEFLADLEKTNPAQAALIRETNPAKAGLIGIGAGFMDIADAVGLVDRSPEEMQALQNLGGARDSFGFGRIVGQAAPFAGAGTIVGSALKGAPLAAQALTQGALGATEGGLVAKGTGGTGEDVLVGTLAGATIGAGAEVLGPVINRSARSLVRRVKGAEARGVLIDDLGQPTKELQEVLEQSGQTFDELVQKAKQDQAGVTKSIVQSGRKGDTLAADQINVSPERLAAAERLGVSDLAPLGVLSSDQAAQELTGALAAIPGTRQSAALDAFGEELGRRADDYILDIGGSLDRGLIDEQLLRNMQSDIGRIKAVEDVLYNRIRSNIGEGTIVNSTPIKNVLSARGRTRRGIKNLSKVERDVFNRVKDGKISYAELDDIISDIGAAIGRETDAYSSVQRSKLNDMYSKLSSLREGVAETFGQKNNLERAKRIGASRFGLQESTQALFGRDLQRSIFPKIDAAVKRIDKGNIREFESIMEIVPEKYRKPIAATMLNTAMTGGRNQSLGLNATQFANWYKNLERNQSAMGSLSKYIGEDSINRLKDFGELAKGLSSVKSGRVRTGVIPEALRRLDDVGGIAQKLYSFGRALEDVPGGGVAGRPAVMVGNIIRSAPSTPASEAADSLMSSKAFRDAVIEASRGGVDTAKYKSLSAKLKQTKQYKNYIKQLDQSNASAIASAGLIPWLASEDEE